MPPPTFPRHCPRMDVQIAEERILVLADRMGPSEAEGRAWARRVEAFGTMAKMAGFLARPKDDEFELAYKERRLQPFWRIACAATSVYERTRDYPISLPPEVQAVVVDGQPRPITAHRIVLQGYESCREETHRQVLVDGLTGQEDLRLGPYLDYAAAPTEPAHLADMAREGTVIVPPKVRASGLVRDAVARAIGKIEADKILEETVRLEAVDLYYRPVYAFRYRRAGKEAVLEVDALTGEVKTTGSTFEQHLGKVLEPKFLLDIGAEAANLFIPGATIAKIALVKGMELTERRRDAKPT